MSLTKTREIKIGQITLGGTAPFVLIAGPCVIESEQGALDAARELKKITSRLGVPWIFKASFDKANRSSVDSYRGPGLEPGLAILDRVRRETGAPVLSDVHDVSQIAPAAEVLDVIQIPAFLCRQTDLLVAAGRTGKPVNIKKGQFMAPGDMQNAAKKVESTGNRDVFITERGSSFGYHNLVVDMRGLGIIRDLTLPVCLDATHSVQLPSAQGSCSGGDRSFTPLLSRSAIAAGVDAVFMEVHPDPDHAMCDGPNSWPMGELEGLLQTLRQIDILIKK